MHSINIKEGGGSSGRNPAVSPQTGGLGFHFGALLFLILPILFNICYFFYALFLRRENPLSELQITVLVIYVILFVALIVTGKSLIDNTNEDSISGMVAQRFNIHSYFTILIIMAISYFTSAFIAANGIASDLTGNDVTEWAYILSTLSPIVTSSILVAPLVVKKTSRELGFTPNAELNYRREGEHYVISFYNFNEKYHALLHFACVGSGVILGFVGAWCSKTFNHADQADYVPFMIMFSMSVAFLSLFLIMEGSAEYEMPRKFRVMIEYVGLLNYMLLIIYTALVSGHLINES